VQNDTGTRKSILVYILYYTVIRINSSKMLYLYKRINSQIILLKHIIFNKIDLFYSSITYTFDGMLIKS